jgi:ribosomal protein S18 acetylase RimI-like enzyme
MIGTPSQYNPSKLLGNPPTELPKGSYFLSLKDPELVASLYVKRYEEEYVIRDVFVKEDRRGTGLGRRIMTEILEFLKPKKKKIILYVDPQNKIARKLYNSLGFQFIKKAKLGDKLLIDPTHK